MEMPVFSGDYYDQWAVKMRTALTGSGLWGYVEFGYDESNAHRKLEHSSNDAKALSCIQRSLSPEIFPRIIHATKAKEAWDILKKEFQGSSKEPPRTRRRDRLAPLGSKRGKALAALAVAAQATIVTKFIYEGVEKLSHHFDGVESSTSSGVGIATDGTDTPSFLQEICDMFSNFS